MTKIKDLFCSVLFCSVLAFYTFLYIERKNKNYFVCKGLVFVLQKKTSQEAMSDTWTAAEDDTTPVTVAQTAEMTTDLAITTETTLVLYVIIAVVPAILVVAIVGLVYKRA